MTGAAADKHQPGDSRESWLHVALSRWADWMNRSALLVVLTAVIATVFVFRYTIDHLGISTDTSDMLSPDLQFRKVYSDFRESFPQYIDTMIVVVSGDTPELARDGATALAARLRQSDNLFKSIYLPGISRFFDRQALLYPSVDELEDLVDRLAGVQAFLGKLAREPSLPALLELTEQALERIDTSQGLDIEPFIREIDAAIAAADEQRFHRMSWQQLFQGQDAGPDSLRQLILLQPRLDYGRMQPASDAMQAVRAATTGLQLDAEHGLRVQVTGEVALAYEELQSASKGAEIAGILSLILVTIVMGVGLQRWQLVAATILTLLCGLILTAGFAAVAIGHLNLISIAFAVLYIGLGVDYAIHVCLRYLELLRRQLPHAIALRLAVRDIGGSLMICTATTATGFYAFVPTSFTGVSELGLISGTGMVISLVLSLTLLPALLTLLPGIRTRQLPASKYGPVARLLRMPARHPRRILWPASAAFVLSLLSLNALRFDANPINLRDPRSESVRTFKELLQSTSASPWALNILAGNHAQAQQLAERIGQLTVVGDTVNIDRFVPDRQQEKLELIDELSLLLGPLSPGPAGRDGADPPAKLPALEQFSAAVEDFSGGTQVLTEAVRRLAKDLRIFLDGLSSVPKDRQERVLAALEQGLLGSFPALLDRLRTGLQASEFRQQDLPEELATRWVTGDGRYRIDVLPAEPLQSERNLKPFVSAVQSAAPQATGAGVFNIESGRVVVAAFTQALLSALAVIVILLLVLLTYKRDVVLVLAPLMLAALVTAGAAVVFGIAFNFANVIALPLLLGIGVDSGVHLVHRFRTAPPADGDLLGSSTIRAIIISALTTICSFGNLALSPHPGAASMGQLLVIGTLATLVCMLLVLPALIYWQRPLPAAAA